MADEPGNPGASDALLTAPQFSMRETARAAGITAGQLKGLLDRRDFILARQNPGTGVRRQASGAEVIKIASIFSLGALGCSQRVARAAAELVGSRALELTLGANGLNAHRGKMSLAVHPLPNDDTRFEPIWQNEARPALPPAYMVLEVDHLIEDVMQKLRATVNEDQPTLGDIVGAALKYRATKGR